MANYINRFVGGRVETYRFNPLPKARSLVHVRLFIALGDADYADMLNAEAPLN